MKKTLTFLLLVLLTLGLYISCNGDVNEKIFSNSYKVQPDGSWKMGSKVYGPSTKPYILVLPKTLNVEKDVQLADLEAGLVTLDEIRNYKADVKKVSNAYPIGNATVELKYDDFDNEYYEYINTGDESKAQNIFMRTTDNDFTETILLNAPYDEFSHYGSLNVATVGEVAPNSYYEYGRVKKVILSIGHLVAKAMSQIDMIIVDTKDASKVSVDVETTNVKGIIAPEGVAITKPASVSTVKTEDAKFMDEDGKFYPTFAETKGNKVTLLGSVMDLSIERTVEIDMFGNEIKGTVTISADNKVTFSDSVGDGALNSEPKGAGKFDITSGNYRFNPTNSLVDKEGSEVKAIQGKDGYYKVTKKAVKPTPTPTPGPTPVLPEDALSGVFSVSATKKVQFSRGNLYWDGDSFEFEANQYTIGTWNAENHVNYFFWSKEESVAKAESYSDASAAASDVFFTNATAETAKEDFTVNGVTGKFRTLSAGEWTYILSTRDNAADLLAEDVTVCGVEHCLVIAPDACLNSYVFDKTKKSYDAAAWATAEAAGLICLPPAGYRDCTDVKSGEGNGFYWASTTNAADKASNLGFKKSDN